MTPEVLAALRGSIKKWEGIVDGTDVDLGAHNCPLCRLFNAEQQLAAKTSCEGCPVKESTGLSYCDGTPYRDYEASENIVAAVHELDFLKSLLPKETDNES